MKARMILSAAVALLLGITLTVNASSPASDPIRLASLSVEKRPPATNRQMTISERPDETVIRYPTARTKDGTLLIVDNCLRWGQDCGQPAANEVCRTRAPGRPIASSFTPYPNVGATVIQSTKDYCWDKICVGFAQVHCVSMKVLGSADIAQMPSDISGTSATAPAAGASDDPATVQSTLDPRTCKSGYVWRVARPDDLVCVTPGARTRTARENAAAASLVDPNGAYGPATCVSGYVWRGAFDGDTVCVTPETRDEVRAENAAAASRRVGN